MKNIYHVRPLYKSFIWGGQKLIDFFKIETTLDNIGTVYHVISLPGELDNIIEETDQPLSEFYRENKELFGISTPHFPIRMTTTANEGFQSYQLHPDDDYAFKHENQQGKVSGAVSLEESDHVKTRLFGNKAKDKDEFKKMILEKDWDNLFTTLDVKDGDFVHTPAGVIHGGYGDGQVTSTFGTNGDITYRFYDLDRNDPNRPLHLQEVFDCATVPEVSFESKHVESEKRENLEVYDYYDVAGEYVAKRFKIYGNSVYSYPDFMFLACVGGSGTISGENISLGETLFIPKDFGDLKFSGEMDIIMVSYKE